MLNFLYTILIYPVYLFVEFIFFTANIIADGNIGISIVLLSIGINIICLPMYNVAEQWQKKERTIQKRMKSKITDIKAVFKGDERYLMLSTYYRQNNYHSLYALRSMFALFIQIPFFIAAYKLLSDSSVMEKSSFLFFTDLGAPDKLFSLGNISINVLPVVMTLINIAASAVYTKGLELKDKLTLYITALIFLVLLYNSPTGLVFYWTLNNIFSLLKNIFYKIKLNAKTWYIIAVIVMMLLTGITTVITINKTKKPSILLGFLTVVIVMIPSIKKLFNFFEKRSISIFNDDKKCFYIFLSSAIALCILIGLVIPSMTIASSAQEFADFGTFKHPLSVLYHPLLQSLGCLFWLLCIYKLFSKNVQKYFAYIAVLLLTAALIDAFIFTGNYGDINNILIFEDATRLGHSMKYFAVNMLAICVGILIITALIYSKFSKLLPSILNIIVLTFMVVTIFSCISIQKSYRRMLAGKINEKNIPKAYRVSKTGKNIFIFMLDRSMNFFLDPIFESSELVKKEYIGFTVFENSIAFGINTNMSTPSLFGGYEYTPENLNKRSKELLVDKHNEALSVLPRLFSEHNWLVGFTDPPWLNYSWLPDLSVFSKYNIRAQNIDYLGKYRRNFLRQHYLKQTNRQTDKQTNPVVHNMLYFSFFRVLPSKVRKIFYNNGSYAKIGEFNNIDMSFLNAYSSLENLCNETEFVSNGDCINIIANNTTHEEPNDSDIQFIRRGELIPLAKQYCLNGYTAKHFYANYLAHESCAKFFRFLKDNNCWNNSRIIIAGDHGRYSMHTIDMDFLKGFDGTGISPQSLIPLIMMKDFNSDGPLQKNYTFMTLADIPILATEGLSAELQKNPFSGLLFKSSQDKTVIKAMHGGDWRANQQLNLTQFKTTEDDWVYVKENVYDPACWSRTNFDIKD